MGVRVAIPSSVIRRAACTLVIAMTLAACGSEAPLPVVEVVTRGPLVLDVSAVGPLQSAKATALLVPGQGWAPRQVIWLAAEGVPVEKDEVLARFSTERGELDLAEALVDLERNTLARAAKQGELAAGQGRVEVDLSKVAVDLSIAERYAGADLSTMARNEVLDAIEDAGYLGAKRDTLRWKQGQSAERGDAELAVLDAQRATVSVQAQRSSSDLEALELRAPHAGVMMLTANWTGDKPVIGRSMQPGSELGRLPDTSVLEVELALPQIETSGIEVGNTVELSPVGRPEQQALGTLSWVASAPKVMSRQSPVKYLSMKVDVPAEVATKYGWVPGQKLQARVILVDAKQAMSVANVAVRSEAGKHYVQVRKGRDFEQREVRLGVRGAARSQVLSGLEQGDEVLLVAAGGEVDVVMPEPPDETASTDKEQGA